MAAKTDYKYESNTGTVHLMKLTSAIGDAGGTQPTGDVNSKIRPELYKSNREYGIRPRYVVAGVTVGTAPNTFVKYKRVPVFLATQFALAAYQPGAALTIDTVEHTIVSAYDEDFQRVAIIDLGTLTVNADSQWQSFTPVDFSDTKKIYAIQATIASANPNQIYSSFVFRYQATLESGLVLLSANIAELFYDPNEQFFPFEFYDKFDKDLPVTFAVRRVPWFSNVSCLASATVQLRTDPTEKLQDA